MLAGMKDDQLVVMMGKKMADLLVDLLVELLVGLLAVR